jgi:alkaline phosphatase D
MSEEGKTVRAGAAISRRQALQMTLAAGVSATSITYSTMDAAEAAATVFLHGVASGDPTRKGVIIWTRITKPAPAERIRVSWEVAEDPRMLRVVQRGVAAADVRRDYTVKVDVDGLRPADTYYYRFECDGELSPIGRTRTLPATGVDRVKLAVFSCSNFELGFFNAYAEALKHDDLDAVVHLGDYIYEYGPDGYATPAALLGLVPRPRADQLKPAQEIVLLDQYRARYALYRRDLNLRRLHMRNPFINVWDDHEITNDAWTRGAENHQPDTEGSYNLRKRAATRAFYEWLPIREPEDRKRIDPTTGNPEDVYRAFNFGDLARLVMIDTRHAGRNLQLDQSTIVGAYLGVPPTGPFPLDVTSTGEPRTLLGKHQATWVDRQLDNAPQVWQLVGNQVLMFYQNAPDINGSPVINDAERAALKGILDQILGPGAGEQLAQLGAVGLPLPVAADAWTGYPTARIAMLNTLLKATNPIVLTGDTHNAWTANLALPVGGEMVPVAPEFGGTSVSSPGFEQTLIGVDPAAIAALLVDSSQRKSPTDKLIFAESARRGYMLVELTRTVATVDHVFTSTVFDTSYTTETKRFVVRAGTRKARMVG